MKTGLAVLVLILLAYPAAARADDSAIAFVKTVSGTVNLVRGETRQKVELGTAIDEKDQVETGADGQVGITFRDDTRISLGPSSRIEMVRFVFKPAEKEHGFVLRLGRGTLEYLSGLTAKLAPDAISIQLPTSTIAVRGTHFLARAEG